MIYDVRRLHLHEKAHGIDLTMTLIRYQPFINIYILLYVHTRSGKVPDLEQVTTNPHRDESSEELMIGSWLPTGVVLQQGSSPHPMTHRTSCSGGASGIEGDRIPRTH